VRCPSSSATYPRRTRPQASPKPSITGRRTSKRSSRKRISGLGTLLTRRVRLPGRYCEGYRALLGRRVGLLRNCYLARMNTANTLMALVDCRLTTKSRPFGHPRGSDCPISECTPASSTISRTTFQVDIPVAVPPDSDKSPDCANTSASNV
jgi:hypothetical protein